MTEQQQEAAPGTFRSDGTARMSRPQVNASLVAVLLLFAAGLFTVKDFVPALVWAVVIAIAVWPLFQRAARRFPRHRHGLLPAAVIVAILLLFVLPLVMIAIRVGSDAHQAMQWVDHARQDGVPPPEFLSHLPYSDKLVSLWSRYLGQPGQASAIAGRAIKTGGLAAAGRHVGAELVHRLVLLGFMLLALFLLLKDAEAVTEQLRVASRRAFGVAGEAVGRQMIASVHGTVDGLVLVGLGEGILLGIAYLFTGVPHPALFGLMTAILAMVPFGAAIAFCIAALVLLATGKAIAAAIVVVLGFVVTFVADHFIRPALIGGATRLPFLWVLLGILGGVEAWGLVGLFLGPAIMAALILLWREWVGAQRGAFNPGRTDPAATNTGTLS